MGIQGTRAEQHIFNCGEVAVQHLTWIITRLNVEVRHYPSSLPEDK